jgi:hypothetical protein
MRSSKNRSRSKGNRNRSVGNIVNRVFDSSGPEGKVRGTPQQIIDKYNQLARDAQLSNDRVAAENFQQHAEHYLRMLAEAQREQEARREQQQNQPHQQQGGGQKDRGEQKGGDGGQGGQAGQNDQPSGRDRDGADAGKSGGFDTVPAGGPEEDAGLVETPESQPKPKRSRSRRPKKSEGGPKGDGGNDGNDGGGGSDGSAQEAAE